LLNNHALTIIVIRMLARDDSLLRIRVFNA
jgi:hypothetical protein